jgi:hypothetical protein
MTGTSYRVAVSFNQSNVAFRVMWPTLASHVLPGEEHAKGASLHHIIAHPCDEPSTSWFSSRIRSHELPETASACPAGARCGLLLARRSRGPKRLRESRRLLFLMGSHERKSRRGELRHNQPLLKPARRNPATR